MRRPVPTAPEYIDRAASLLRAAAAADGQDEKIRLLQDVEILLQMAKQQLVDAKFDPRLPNP